MPHTLDSALANSAINVISRNDTTGSYVIRIGSLETPVRIELSRNIGNDVTSFSLSHAIKTPLQAGAYHPSRLQYDDPPYALYRAIDSLTSYYVEAVDKGLKPDESWLVIWGSV